MVCNWELQQALTHQSALYGEMIAYFMLGLASVEQITSGAQNTTDKDERRTCDPLSRLNMLQGSLDGSERSIGIGITSPVIVGECICVGERLRMSTPRSCKGESVFFSFGLI